MDAWIIAENDALSARLEESLRRRGHNCPSDKVIPIAELAGEMKRFASAEGIFFFAVSRLEPVHLESLRSIRGVINAEALLVAISAVADTSAVLNAVRVGANDFIALNNCFEDDLSRLYSRVHLSRRRRDERAYTVTVLPCQSAADANLVALNLAAVFASHTASCGLLDFYFRGGDLALLLKQSPRHTVMDLLTQLDPIDQPMLRQVVTTHECGIQLLAGPTTLGDLSAIRPQSCHEIITLAQRSWPAVVVNAEDVHHAQQVQALSVSDDIVLTVRLDIASLHRAHRHIELLSESQVAREKIHVVALGAGHAGELPPSAVKQVLQVAEVRPISDDPVAMIRSVNLGNPIVLEHPNSKAGVALRQFAESLLGELQGLAETKKPLTTFKAAAALAANAIPFCR